MCLYKSNVSNRILESQHFSHSQTSTANEKKKSSMKEKQQSHVLRWKINNKTKLTFQSSRTDRPMET